MVMRGSNPCGVKNSFVIEISWKLGLSEDAIGEGTS